MSELEEAIKLFGREDLLGGYGIQDTDTNIEVFMSIKDMVKYYRQDLEIERLNNIINEIDFYIYEKMRTIYIRANGDIGKYSFKALEEVWHKVSELKGSDKE